MGRINNETVEYKDLSKIQRLAIFLIALGPDAASSVLAGFEDNDIENICREIGKMGMVDYELKAEAVKEFTDIIGPSLSSIIGGKNFAQKTLEITKGEQGAQLLLGKIEPGGSITSLIQEVCELQPRQVYNLLQKEQTQTIAYVISHLSNDKMLKVINMLPEERRDEVLQYLGEMEEAPLEMLANLAQTLKPQIRQAEKPLTFKKTGGVETVAALLNQLGKDVAKNILGKIDENNPELADLINKKMFSFEDLLILTIEDLQRVAREVETNDLVLALKGASKELTKAIMGSVSKRAAESLKDELDMLGAVKVKLVQEAQERIIQVVKRLEEEGAIELGENGNDVID